jgi:hypothetical protein
MQPRISLVCTVVLILSNAVFFWGEAMAADPPKQGTWHIQGYPDREREAPDRV